MAFLFIIFLFAIILAFLRQRKASLFLITLGILLSLAMLYYHATDTLQVYL